MAVTIVGSFDSWLSEKLRGLNTDEGVFGSYIRGILEGDETEDEKSEALEGILAGITEENIGGHVSEILAAWLEFLPGKDAAEQAAPAEDVEARLAKLLESQSLQTTIQRSTCSEEERRIREAIVAQYSQMTDSEESDAENGEEDTAAGGGSGGGGGGGDCGIEKNTNAANIAQQIKEKREQAKIDSQKKKEKDKEDREKQKQLKEEKKEKRKTVKGERRR